MRTFKVYTFYTPRIIDGEETEPKLARISAYTLWASTEWSGCRAYDITAESGAKAKRAASLLRLEHELRRYEHQDGVRGSEGAE